MRSKECPGRDKPDYDTRAEPYFNTELGGGANLLFKTVDVLGIVPNQLTSIMQTKDEAMCSCWAGMLNLLAHLGNATVEERPHFGSERTEE